MQEQEGTTNNPTSKDLGALFVEAALAGDIALAKSYLENDDFKFSEKKNIQLLKLDENNLRQLLEHPASIKFAAVKKAKLFATALINKESHKHLKALYANHHIQQSLKCGDSEPFNDPNVGDKFFKIAELDTVLWLIEDNVLGAKIVLDHILQDKIGDTYPVLFGKNRTAICSNKCFNDNLLRASKKRSLDILEYYMKIGDKEIFELLLYKQEIFKIYFDRLYSTFTVEESKSILNKITKNYSEGACFILEDLYASNSKFKQFCFDEYPAMQQFARDNGFAKMGAFVDRIAPDKAQADKERAAKIAKQKRRGGCLVM